MPGVEHVVLNAEDTFAQAWIADLAIQRALVLYSLHAPQAAVAQISHVWVRRYVCQQPGLRADVVTPWGEIQIENPYLMGVFNLK
ncbi:hypothetical protein [Rickettsiella massiliensis]|uniref:hypothetical protein n=1 Tax=Rickettsiella massiliensis TaxID=676517 RepID=UPI00029AAFC7|nr:hypothetical protein [Rickettsiella massiliensis]